MAWIFLPGAMMMPSETPMDKADPKLTLGVRDLQVRGRLVSHLQHFIDTYMEPHGLDHSEIEETPDMDYTCRFYATKEAYAQGMYHAMMDIDYRKFKEQSERLNADGTLMFAKGKEYHQALTSIWSVSTRLNPAGGYYAPLSLDNPRGYDSRRWSRGGTSSPRFVGSTFLSGDYGGETFDDYDIDNTPMWTVDSLMNSDGEDFDIYTPAGETKIDRLLTELADIPTGQWQDYLEPWEYELIEPYKTQARKDERRRARAARRKSRRNKHEKTPF